MNLIPPVAALLAASLCAAAAAEPQAGKGRSPRAAAVAPASPMLDFLLAEFAGQRGGAASGADALFTLARQTRDPGIARRSLEWALKARQMEQATRAAALWLSLEPESQAGVYLADLLGESKDLAKARAQVQGLLAAESNKAPLLAQLNMLFARYPNKDDVRTVIDALLKPYPMSAEGLYSAGWAAFLANDIEAAVRSARAALAVRPDWEKAGVLMLAALRKQSVADALSFAEAFLARAPQALELRQNYARELATERRYKEARREFATLAEARPKDAALAYSNALLAQQLSEWDVAEREFNRALGLGYRDEDAVFNNLAQIAEQRKDFTAARAWLSRITGAEAAKAAQRRIAALIGKSEGVDAARAYLAQIPAESKADRVQNALADAQLLRDARRFQAAFDLLEQQNAAHPNEPDLMYDHAMAAERVGRLDVLEANLRALIELKPDFAHAYNALGYTFADRSERLSEAKALIEKAISLSPDDPFILDSLGWVNYRLGNLVEAARILQQAYAARSDPEIAAHLSEVLWAKGKRDEALAIVRQALTAHPEHEMLTSMLHKLKP
jgi:tetratricopeptide (TPR) repeat protein